MNCFQQTKSDVIFFFCICNWKFYLAENIPFLINLIYLLNTVFLLQSEDAEGN